MIRNSIRTFSTTEHCVIKKNLKIHSTKIQVYIAYKFKNNNKNWISL